MPEAPTQCLIVDIDDVPTEPYLLADYLELRCLISQDGYYTASELAADYARQKERGRAAARRRNLPMTRSPASADSPVAKLLRDKDQDEQDPVAGDQAAREEMAEAGPDDNPPPPEPSDVDMRSINKANDAIKLVQHRIEVFQDDYPFTLDGEEELELRTDVFASFGRKLYLYLLLASSYKYLAQQDDRDDTTASFERLCLIALQQYFGKKLEAYVFGTGAASGSRYAYTDFRDALEAMVKDASLETTKLWDRERDNEPAAGDRGLDVVGWIPFGDGMDHQFIVFGQCATGRNWDEKQLEASMPVWEPMAAFTSPVTLAFMMSFSWRRPGGGWPRAMKLASSNLVLDRGRIVALLSDLSQARHVPVTRLARRFVAVDELSFG